MNITKLYSEAIGKGRTVEEQVTDALHKAAQTHEQSAGRTQLKINWLNSTITQELLTKLAAQRKELIETSVQLACNYHNNLNHLEIVKNLIMADQIQKLINSTEL